MDDDIKVAYIILFFFIVIVTAIGTVKICHLSNEIERRAEKERPLWFDNDNF